MTAGRVEVRWDGVRRVYDDVDVQIREANEFFGVRSRYEPRTFAFEAPWPDAAAWIADGHAPEGAVVQLTLGSVDFGARTLLEFQATRGSAMARFTVGEHPDRRTRTIPPTYQMNVRYVDADVMAQLKEYWAAGWNAYLASLPKKAQKSQVIQQNVQQIIEAYDTDPLAFRKKTIGAVYPMVIGQPGWDDDTSTHDYTTPAVRAHHIDIDTKTLLVAGHPVPAESVIIWTDDPVNLGGWSWCEYATSQRTDNSGRVVTVVDVTSGNALSGSGTAFQALHDHYSEQNVYFSAWSGESRGLSGDPVDVLLALLSFCPGVRVDVASFEDLRHRLRGLQLSAGIDVEVSAWDLLERDVLPLLPIVLVPTRGGTGARFVDLSPSALDIGRRVVVGPDFQPLAESLAAEHGGNDVANDWLLHSNYNVAHNTYQSFRRADLRSSAAAARSATVHGLRSQRMQSTWIYGQAMNSWCVHQLLRRTVRTRPPLSYLARPSTYGVEGRKPLLYADTFRLTDPELGITDAPAIVRAVSRTPLALRFDVALLDP